MRGEGEPSRFGRILTTVGCVLLLPLAVPLLPVLLFLIFFGARFQKPVDRSREEVRDVLERYLAGDDVYEEWDDFTCIAIADPELEAIRGEINEVYWDDEALERVIRRCLARLDDAVKDG